jgi:hypothetical protein
MRRSLVVAMIPLLLVGLGLYARSLAGRAYQAFTGYETPFASEPPPGAPPLAPADSPPAPAFPALSEQVVLVLVDGLGLEPSRRLPFLNELRARGADLRLRIGLPSLSLPGRAVMLSGAWQEVHGQATNQNPRSLRVEHLFQLVRRAGRETALATDPKPQKLFTPYVSHVVLYPEQPETAPFTAYVEAHRKQVAQALELLRTRSAPFTMIELHLTDEAGHTWGGASDEYRQATDLADAAIREMVPLLDLSRTTLVVTADHGHIAVGGHGGPEDPVMTVPLVMAGRGVRPGAAGEATQADTASTLAALLGVPIPSSNQGRPLLDALELTPDQRVALLRATLDARRVFLSRYLGRLRSLDGMTLDVVRADIGETSGAPAQEGELLAALDRVDAALASVKQRRLAMDATVRSRRSLLFAVVPFAVCAVAFVLGPYTRRDLLVSLAAAGTGVALYYALLPALGLSYSLSAVNKDEWMAWFFQKDMALGLGTAALASFLAAFLRARAGGSAWEATASAWLATAVFVYLFVVKVAIVYWRHGVILRWHMPEQYWSFGFYLDVLVVMAVGFAAPFLGALGWLVHRIAARGAPAP